MNCPNNRSGVDADWRVLVAFERRWPAPLRPGVSQARTV